MKAWLSALTSRWDVDVDARTRMPFDEALALVNLRRLEIGALLSIVTDLLQIGTGYRLGSMFLGVPLSLAMIVAARAAQRWRNVTAQRRLTIIFIGCVLTLKLWGTAEVGAVGDRLSTGFPFTLFTITLLLVMPPRTMAVIVGITMTAYAGIVATSALAPREKIAAIVSTGMVAAISLVANWLILRARRADHELRVTIRRQNEQLQARNDELNQLMAITAHDLRSPLYGLRNLFDLAQRRASREPMLPLRVLGDSMFSLDAMIALVTRLLHAHAAEHEPLRAIVLDDVRSHLIAAARRIGPQVEAAGTRVTLTLPDAPVCARFDDGALGQILDNLLGNAVRYSPPGARIEVACASAPEGALVTVSDEGPGIAPELRQTLFTKFARGSEPREGTRPRMGMGLFIAAQLAERMGATLKLDQREGCGARFRIALPDHLPAPLAEK